MDGERSSYWDKIVSALETKDTFKLTGRSLRANQFLCIGRADPASGEKDELNHFWRSCQFCSQIWFNFLPSPGSSPYSFWGTRKVGPNISAHKLSPLSSPPSFPCCPTKLIPYWDTEGQYFPAVQQYRKVLYCQSVCNIISAKKDFKVTDSSF